MTDGHGSCVVSPWRMQGQGLEAANPALEHDLLETDVVSLLLFLCHNLKNCRINFTVTKTFFNQI